MTETARQAAHAEAPASITEHDQKERRRMPHKLAPFLRNVMIDGLAAENLQAPLHGHDTPRENEDSGVFYVAVGVDAEKMKDHLAFQRSVPLSRRRWICDPERSCTIKLIAFPYRSTAERAIEIYLALGTPSVEVTLEDLPYLLEDCSQMLVPEADNLVLMLLGMRLGPIQHSLRQQRDDEIARGLQDPVSAREACALLNARDKLYGRNVVAGVGELPWSIHLTERAVLPARAVHRDGNAVFFEGEWRFMPLADFWHRYGNPRLTPYDDLPRKWWYSDLKRANLPKPKIVETVDDVDDGCILIADVEDDDDDRTFISDPDESFSGRP
ncbi:hypothetical protein ACVWWK_002662 [Bradyrhizobium sp. LB9.1b]